ncbi:hypothetical protein [Eleftheria terrae]|uniref:hypothetical protein n=1 Tax=Eleftheria terrae TaxID=1597781 RepID=UPI00263A9134|nr:hypothetical protein [Eleftheria terrae]WKB56015.1 hypothetical protein N7L95_28520 [Eleftheria terrae]
MNKLVRVRATLSAEDALQKALRCIRISEQFRHTASRALDARLAFRGDVPAGIPAVVCAAFAVELAFKGILLLERNEQWVGHDLDALFRVLSAETQQSVEAAVKVPGYPRIPGRTMQFSEALRNIKTLFEDWRYAYEASDDMAADVTFVQQVAAAAHQIAERLESARSRAVCSAAASEKTRDIMNKALADTGMSKQAGAAGIRKFGTSNDFSVAIGRTTGALRTVKLVVAGEGITSEDDQVYVPAFVPALAATIQRLKSELNFLKHEELFVGLDLEDAVRRLVNGVDADIERACGDLRVFDWGPTTDDYVCFLLPLNGRLYLGCYAVESDRVHGCPVVPYDLIQTLEAAHLEMSLGIE